MPSDAISANTAVPFPTSPPSQSVSVTDASFLAAGQVRPPPVTNSPPAPSSSITSTPPPHTTQQPNSPPASSGRRGLAWAGSASDIKALNLQSMSWYYAWNRPPIALQATYIPLLKSSDTLTDFTNVMANLPDLPPAILGFNEPNLAGQANMSPQDAANLYKAQLQNYRTKGVKVSAPATAGDQNWLTEFFEVCTGCTFDIVQVHWYGGWNELDNFKNWVSNSHDLFSSHASEFWITEWGVTSASGGSEQQVLDFLNASTQWLEQQSYITKIAWFGAWSANPDGYASDYCALVDDSGALTAAGQFWTS